MAPHTAPRSMSLEAALEALYPLFAQYQPRGLVMGCTHCMSEEEMAQLTATPLRAHTGELLGRFAFSAMSTWGTETDFKYYLPRILELVPFRSVGAVYPEMIAEKLLLAGWGTWPDAERGAIRAYVEALWDLLLSLEVGSLCVEAVDVLGWATRLFDDVSSLLSTWERASDPAADVHLARVLQAFDYEPKKVPRGFGSQGATVVTWLFRPQTQQRLEKAYLANPDAPYSDEISNAADILHWMLEPS